ncbi:hypothetical protein THRCLA_09777 [Thraustotheca clavata]|uniref:Uncharacterized protein n=1 Tax=Thraustotheca clavata TaxID=74557 RepID=A0A1V9YUW4_9STRA|nr:hypothetical protein THRCLA_09777 [Thraustotheca clavata]
MDIMDDTLAAVHTLLERYHRAFATVPLPSLVISHHMYGCNRFSNRTVVDQRVHQLRQDGILMTLQISLPGQSVSALILTNDYIAFMLEKSKRLRAARMFAKILKRVSMKSSISKSDILAEMRQEFVSRGRKPPSDETLSKDIVHLVQMGFLITTIELTIERYTFTLPRLGALKVALYNGRRTIKVLLKRAQYQEMTQHDLVKRKVKGSPFNMEYHILEMTHTGLLERVRTSTSYLLKYIDPKPNA